MSSRDRSSVVALAVIAVVVVASAASGVSSLAAAQQPPPTPAPSPGKRGLAGTDAEAQWQKIVDEVTPKLVQFKALPEAQKKQEKFEAEIARIQAFAQKYDEREPAAAGNARIYLAQQILADALHKERDAVGVLRDVVVKCTDGFVAAAAAVRAGQYLVQLGDEAALKELRALYLARPDHESPYSDMLDLYCRRVLAQPGRPFPDVPLVDLDGRTIEPTSLRGHLVVVLVFTVENEESRKELGNLVRLLARSDEAVTAVGISLDKEKKRLADVLRENGAKFPVDWSGKQFKSPVATALGIDKIPATFLLDPSGKILVARIGSVGGELGTLVEAELAKLRKSGALPPPAGR